MKTKTQNVETLIGYNPSQFPPFAVTVDVVILTMSEGVLHVLLVRRGQAPFKGEWAIPGGFKLPNETLDGAAKRELTEETGVDAAFPGVVEQQPAALAQPLHPLRFGQHEAQRFQ